MIFSATTARGFFYKKNISMLYMKVNKKKRWDKDDNDDNENDNDKDDNDSTSMNKYVFEC